jgi:hypothetical protein
MPDPVNLPALREAVALIRRDIPEDQPGVYDDRRPVELAALRLALALPALLDEVEVERIENARLREAVQVFEKAANALELERNALRADLAAMTEKRNAIFEDATKMGRDLTAARAVLDTARFPSSEANGRLLVNLDAAAWHAYQETKR